MTRDIQSGRIASRDRQFALLLVAAGVLIQVPALFWGIPGGKAINNALRILDGDVPYRDFWTMYAPGHFYLTAGIIKLFGQHVWAQGVAAQLLSAIDGAILFLIARRLGLQRRPALLVGAFFILALWGHKELTSYEPALLFLFLALDRAVSYAQGNGARQLFLAGLLCGTGAWFKHDISFHVAFGITAGLSAAWLLISDRRPAGWVSPVEVLTRVGGGALLAVLPLAAFLAWKAGRDVWVDLIVFPATEFRVVRGEPYPPLLPDLRPIAAWLADLINVERAADAARNLARWIEANLPQVVFLVAVFLLVRKRRTLDPIVIATVAVSLATMLLFWASAHVQQNTHFVSLWVFSVLLGALMWIPARGRPALRPLLALVFIVYTGALLIPQARRVAMMAYFWPNHATLNFPSVAGIRVPGPQYEIYQPIVSFIREHVPETEPIYVGLVRHDAVVISNQSFYYVAGRPIASRYNELHPGLTDREHVQREIIADLNRLQVRCAVLWDFGWPEAYLNNMLADRRRDIPDIGATVLDEFLRREFQEVGRYGEYVLLWRKGGEVPPAPR